MTITLSSEFRLIAAASGAPSAVDRRRQLNALAGSLDWPAVLQLAQRHRVEGLIWRALSDAEITPPPDVAADLRARAQAIARTSLKGAAESARLQRMLTDGGIPNLVLKGSAVEVLAHGRLGLKNAWDIDLLVEPAQVGAAIESLTRLGYEITEPRSLSASRFQTWIRLAKECELRHRRSGTVVELHWRLADGPSLLPGLGIAAPTQDVDVGGGMILCTFAPAELYSYLCVHGAMHGWSRLKWLADLGALLSQSSPVEVEALHRRALQLGVGLCSAQALVLCMRLFGLQVPGGLAAEFESSRRVAWLVKVAVQTMAGGGAVEIEDRRFAATRILLSQMVLGGDVAHAWAELRYRATSLHDRVYFPLPRGMTFLYPLVRLPLWVWRRISRRGAPT